MNKIAEIIQEPIFKGRGKHIAAGLAGTLALMLATKGLTRSEEPVYYPSGVSPVGSMSVNSQDVWVFKAPSEAKADQIDCGSQGDFAGMTDNPKIPVSLKGFGQVVVCIGTGSDYPVFKSS